MITRRYRNSAEIGDLAVEYAAGMQAIREHVPKIRRRQFKIASGRARKNNVSRARNKRYFRRLE